MAGPALMSAPRCGPRMPRAMAFTVKSRRARSSGTPDGDDLGQRTRVRVGLAAGPGHVVAMPIELAAGGPEAIMDGDRCPEPRRQRAHRSGDQQVEIGGLETEHQVTDGPADEEDVLRPPIETAEQRRGGGQRGEAVEQRWRVGDHRAMIALGSVRRRTSGGPD